MNYFETLYDRVRGKEPVNSLAPMIAPTPGVMTDQPDPAYTSRQNPLNVLGLRVMGAMEDPRNAWIGMGPVAAMAKIPKAAKAVKKAIVGKLDNEVPADMGEVVKPPTVESMRQAHFYEKAGDDLKGLDRPSRNFGYDQYMEMWPTREDAVRRWGDIPEEQMRIEYKKFLKEQKRQNAEKVAELQRSIREREGKK